MKIWQKDYTLNKDIEKFTVGNDYLLDLKLVKYDCLASIAHAGMLKKTGILKQQEFKQLEAALNEIIQQHSKGKFKIQPEDEDCHTAIENYLIKKLGDVGKKIHTARSRNDQVLAALRLYYKQEIGQILLMIDNLTKSMTQFKKEYGKIAMPGYTHMRKAMPSSVGLWTGAFIESIQDNKKLTEFVLEFIDQSPLGSCAGYGSPIELDKALTAKLAGFKKVQENPIYVQNSKGKFESLILHSFSQVLFDLNKIASDLILFSMPEIGYFELAQEICTGSSIMPHKKNPDVLELLRAKYHKMLAYEFEIKSIMSNLISGYNRDSQLIKEPMIKGIELTKECLNIAIIVMENIKINKEKCEKAMSSELYAVEKAMKLVEKGIPFRDAYKQVSKDFI